MIASVLFGMLVFMLIILFYSIKENKRLRLKRRLERHLVLPQKNEFSIRKLLGFGKFIEKLQEKLFRSGVKADAEEVFLWFVFISVVSAAVFVLSGFAVLGVIAPVILYFILDYLLDYMGRRRLRKIEEQFRDFAKMLGAYLKMVPSFSSVFMKAAEEVERPLREYTDRAVKRFQLGEDIESAVEEFKNIPSMYIRAWADSIIFAVRMKSDLSKVCDRTAEKISGKIRMANRINAMTMQAKSLMVTLAGIMAFMMVMTLTSSPDFIKTYASPIGKAVIAYAVLSYFFSTLYVIKRIDREMGS